MHSDEEHVDALVARLGEHWGWVLGYGILTVAAGIAVLVWPGVTLLVVAVLFGIQLVVFGIFRFVSAFTMRNLGAAGRTLYALLGVISLIVGLWAIRHVDVTLVALAVFLGIYWIVNGTVEIFTAFDGRAERHRGPRRPRLSGHIAGHAGGLPRHLAADLRLHGDQLRVPPPLHRPRGVTPDHPCTLIPAPCERPNWTPRT
jgi:uncharacterized membrane protein HdeD (DUF308 family)